MVGVEAVFSFDNSSAATTTSWTDSLLFYTIVPEPWYIVSHEAIHGKADFLQGRIKPSLMKIHKSRSHGRRITLNGRGLRIR